MKATKARRRAPPGPCLQNATKGTIMSATNQNKVTRQVRIGQVITGIEKYFSTLPAIPVGGTSYTPAALVARLQSGLDAIKQSSNAKAAWLAVVQTERNTF